MQNQRVEDRLILRCRHTQLMPRTGIPDWRAERAYDELRGIDSHGLMWEWLRRDEAYVAWQVRASPATRGAGPSAPAHPHQSGPPFPRNSGAPGPGASPHLASQ